MSLTLYPVNASLFLKPDSMDRIRGLTPVRTPAPTVRVNSLESLVPREAGGRLDRVWRDHITGRWVEGCSRRLLGGNLGTTFPPRAGLAPPYREKMRKMGQPTTCYSEPDLAPSAASSDDDDEDEEKDEEDDMDRDDDDHLFEFDLSPDRELEEEEEDPVPPLELCPDRRRTFSVTSEGSGGSCSHRKAAEAEESYCRPGGGFSSIFGSTSSGLGSDRRSLEDRIDELDGGASIEPAEWRDYISDRLSSEGTSTPIGSSTSLSSEGSARLLEAPATPILALSPASTSPLISPDSLLEGGHLEEMRFSSSSCPECEKNAELDLSSLNLREKEEQHEEDEKKKQHQDVNSNTLLLPGSAQVEEHKMTSLLDQLNQDRRYPGVQGDDSKSSTPIPAEVVRPDELELHHGMSSNVSIDSTVSTVSDISPLRETTVHFKDDEDFERPKLRKCSSLKVGRSPSRNTGERKIVRFADIFGLDLSEVKTFTDEIPRIPRRAFQDLDVDMSEFDVGSPCASTPIHKYMKEQQSPPSAAVSTTSLVPMFTQPGCSPSFFDMVRERKVCLETAYTETPFTVVGLVRVLNLDFHKAVTVRWTVNDWNTSSDLAATYVDGSSDGTTDKFSFSLSLGCLPVGSRVQFCLRYSCSGAEFWDSNNGANYVFQVFLSSNSPGGVGGINYRSSPMSFPSRNSFTAPYQAYQSPSHHGDDPWLRYM